MAAALTRSDLRSELEAGLRSFAKDVFSEEVERVLAVTLKEERESIRSMFQEQLRQHYSSVTPAFTSSTMPTSSTLPMGPGYTSNSGSRVPAMRVHGSNRMSGLSFRPLNSLQSDSGSRQSGMLLGPQSSLPRGTIARGSEVSATAGGLSSEMAHSHSAVADFGLTFMNKARKTHFNTDASPFARRPRQTGDQKNPSAYSSEGASSANSGDFPPPGTRQTSYVLLTPVEAHSREDDEEDDGKDDQPTASKSSAAASTAKEPLRRKEAKTKTMAFQTKDTALDRSRGKEEYEELQVEEPQDMPDTWLSSLVRSSTFDYVTACVILLNAAVIGVQTDYMARHWTRFSPVWCRALDGICCLYFTIEMALRLHVYRSDFFRRPKRWWNVLDLVLVLSQILDNTQQLVVSILNCWQSRYATRFLLFASVLRILRILRIIRVLNLFGELRMLLIAIAQSGRSVCWCIAMLSLMTFCISVYLTQVVTDHKVEYLHALRDEELENLERFFGSLSVAMLSMYEMISEGIHWHEVMDPVRESVSPWLSIVFAAYMGFTIFAVLNVITGIFVETAMQSIGEDRRKGLMRSMRELFERADADGSGTMTLEEFQAQIETEEMKTMLKAMDLDKDEAVDLFQLLDVGDTGELEVHAFLHGVLRLSGAAKAVELSTFMHEWKRWVKVWQVHALFIEECLLRTVGMLEFTAGVPNDEHAIAEDNA